MINLHTLAMTALLSTAGSAWAQNAPAPAPVRPAEQASGMPALPRTPAAANTLLYARPFTLEQGYEFEWRTEKPTVRAGWLLVLEVDPLLVFPRQTAEPILYVGKTTAERVNIGSDSGRVIVIVPSDVNDQGEVALDLSQAMMWFGTPGLPEQVDVGRIEAERTWAANARIAPFSAEAIAAARDRAGQTLHVATREALRSAAGDLIKTYSPQEAQLADGLIRDAQAVAAQQPVQVGD